MTVGNHDAALAYPLTRRDRSAGFEISADGVTDDIADLAVALVGDALDGLVGLVVDAQVHPVGVAGSPGQGRPSDWTPGQSGRVEACLRLCRQAPFVVGVECVSCLGRGRCRAGPLHSRHLTWIFHGGYGAGPWVTDRCPLEPPGLRRVAEVRDQRRFAGDHADSRKRGDDPAPVLPTPHDTV